MFWKEALIVLASIGMIVVTSISKGERTAPPAVLLAPPKDLPHLVFGYNEIAADSLWLRVVQDIDLCKPGQGALIASNPEEFQRLAKLAASQKGPRCEKGWTFHMIDAITELAPRFRQAYLHAAPVLSVLTDDREGARIIYEKGVKAYPNDSKIVMGAAYHYLKEINDQKRAAELLVLAGNNGAPEWVHSLAAQLYTKAGQAFLAKVHLTETIQKFEASDPEHPMLIRLRERLAEAEKALEEVKQERQGQQNLAPSQTETH